MQREELIVQLEEAKDKIRKLEEYEKNLNKIEEKKQIVRQHAESHISEFDGPLWVSWIIGIALGIGFYCLHPVFLDTLVVILVITGIAALIIFVISRTINEDQFNKAVQEYYDEYAASYIQDEFNLRDEINQFLVSSSYTEAVQIVPADYFDIESIDWFIAAIRNNRADTMKEVLNLYETHLHNERMEELQRLQLEVASKSLNEQRQQTALQNQEIERITRQLEISEKIMKNTKSTKRAAYLNAFIAVVKK